MGVTCDRRIDLISTVCRETAKIKLGDMAALYAFRRAFHAEAKKLRKPPTKTTFFIQYFYFKYSDPPLAVLDTGFSFCIFFSNRLLHI